MRHLQLYQLMSQRKRRAQRARVSVRQRSGRVGLGCGATLALLLVALVLAGSLAYASLTAGLPVVDRLEMLLDPDRGPLLQPTRVYDRTGLHLLYSLENAGAPRRYLYFDPDRSDHFSPLLAQVMVSINDPAFWKHPGVTRASLLEAQPVTLAEKLVDALLLDGEPLGARRALRARLLAAQVTAKYGRVQVLEWYLNSVYFGHMAYGAESAAQLYLNKSARDLTLAEASLLAAAAEAPALNPLDAYAAAVERQKTVLDRLLSLKVVAPEDYLRARAETLNLPPPMQPPEQDASAFARLALADLSARLGYARLERGGLRVITSLDYDLQVQMNCAVRAQLARMQGESGPVCEAARLLPALPPDSVVTTPDARASLAVLDLQQGELLAYVGDLSLAGGEAEIAARHEPGSMLAPFVALSAFARGMGPASLVWDIPASLPEDLQARLETGETYHGPARLRNAVVNDYLAPLAQLLAQVGPNNVWRLAEPVGLVGLERESDPLALLYEGGDMPLSQFAQAYATIARMGEQIGQRPSAGAGLQPILVRSVQELGGTLLLEQQPETQPVLSAPLAYLVHDMLADDTARRSSLGYPNALEIGRPSAAKVGRSAGGSQVWTAGYTPHRLALTWVGLPGAPAEAALNVNAAAGLWYAAMQFASRDLPATGWQTPAGVSRVEVCDPSGLLPTAACPQVVGEIFLTGTEPVEADSLYRVFQVNRETGRLATVFTPPELVEEKVYFVPPAEALAWASAAGWSQPPESYDLIQAPQASADVNISAPGLFAYVRGQVMLRGSAGGPDFVSYRVQVGQGLNPLTWLQVGPEHSTPVQAGTLETWDTEGMNGLYAVRLQVVRAQNRVDTAVIQVTVDNLSPDVRVPYPLDGEVLQAPDGLVTLQAQVSDNIAVTRVEWLLDGQMIGQHSQPPYSYPWQAGPGKHTLVVRAVDPAGNAGESPPVTFEVVK